MIAPLQPPSELPADLIGMKEAAALLPSNRPGKKLHVGTLYRWLFSGRLQGWKIGRHWFVSRAQVLAQAVPHEVQTPAPTPTQQLRRRRREYEEAREYLRQKGVIR